MPAQRTYRASLERHDMLVMSLFSMSQPHGIESGNFPGTCHSLKWSFPAQKRLDHALLISLPRLRLTLLHSFGSLSPKVPIILQLFLPNLSQNAMFSLFSNLGLGGAAFGRAFN